MAPLCQALSELGNTVEEIASEFRLVALNAQVYAAQHGAATGLEVLSTRTCDVADEILEVGGEMSNALGDLQEGLARSLSRCQASLAESSELRESIQEEGGRDEETLHDFRRHTTGLLSNVSSIGSEIRRCAKTMNERCSFEDTGIGALARSRDLFDELKVASELALSSPLPSEGDGATVNHFRNYYSVRDEIVIHDRLFGSCHNAESDSAEAVLFGDEESIALSSEQLEGDVILFDSEDSVASVASNPEEESAKKLPSKGDVDFGDNVELF